MRLWGGFHLPSVGLAIAGAALVSELVHNSLAWFLVGFVITTIYLTVIAAQFSIAESSLPASGGDQDRPDTTEVPGSAERPEATDAG